MRGLILAGSAGIALAVLGSSQAVAGDDRAEFDAAGHALSAALQKRDCEAALAAGAKLTGSPMLADMTDDSKLFIWDAVAYCDATLHRDADGLEAARQATAFTKAQDWDWLYRIEAAMIVKRPDEVADAVTQLADARPNVLNAIPVRYFYAWRAEQIVANRTATLRRVLFALDHANYVPSGTLESADGLWLQYAGMLADDGESRRATEVLAKVRSVEDLLPAKLDARFTAAVAADPRRFDLRAAAERELAADQAASAAHPRLLQAIIQTARDLRNLELYDEALHVVQGALDKVNKAPKSSPAYDDLGGQLNWAYNLKAEVLLELGRVDEAVATEQAGAALAEDGGQTNVSQTINLAGFLDAAGKPAEALRELAAFDHEQGSANPYGLGWVHAERACAYEALGNTSERDRELAYTAAHTLDNLNAALKARLCVNDLDGAAALMIAQLHDLGHRETALLLLSKLDRPPHPSAFQAELWRRLGLVARRADVMRAVNEVGRNEQVRLAYEGFVDVF